MIRDTLNDTVDEKIIQIERKDMCTINSQN